jgi:O-antigen ligase
MRQRRVIGVRLLLATETRRPSGYRGSWPAVWALAGLAFVSEFNTDVAEPIWNKLVKWAVLAVVVTAPLVVFVARSAVLPEVLTRTPLCWIALWMAWTVAAAAWSAASVNGAGMLVMVGIVSCWMLPIWFVSVHGWDRCVQVLACGGAVFLLLGFVYAVLGDPAVAWDGARLSGISWSPTHLGRIGALTVVFGALMLTAARMWTARLAVCCIAVGLAAAMASGTRTTLLGLAVVGVVVLWRMRRRSSAVVLLSAILAAAITSATFGVSTFDVGREIAGATGRFEIWSETFGLVMQAPVTGFGTASGEVMFDEIARRGDLAWRAFTAHNTLLHVLLTQGMVGLGLLLAAAAGYIVAALKAPNPGRDGVVILLLINSATEALVEQPSLSIVALAAAFTAAANDAVSSRSRGTEPGTEAPAGR